MGEIIFATNQNNGTAYRFEITDTATNEVQIIDRPARWFTLTMLSSYDYGATYSIRVEVQYNGTWLGYYGTACLVSSPAVIAPEGGAQVTGEQCGSTLPTITTIVMTNSIPNATGYRFRITNMNHPLAPSQVQVLDRSIRWFNFTMLPKYNYGTTYQVEVAVKTTSGYSAFGNPCMISTPAVPTLTNCGATVSSDGALVSTTSLNKVTMYKFELTNLSTNAVTTIERPLQYFKFNSIGGYTSGANYSVRVAVMVTGYYSPFGPACTITAPGAARFEEVKEEPAQLTAFKAVAYPNPYVNTFGLDVTTSSDEGMQVKIYDMIGKLLEVRNVPADAIKNQTFGDRYPSGVYNVILTQGDITKTLRVIKR
jgi:hypothetical protein